jgi:hypothetical protein
MRYVSSPLGFVGCAVLLLSVDHCSSSSSKPSAPSSTVVGTAGGTVESTDGVITVNIPAGAVSGDVTVTVTPESAPPAGAVGAVYDIGPSGTVFNSPVTMTFHYALASLGGAAPSSLRAATYGANTWQILAGGSVDTSAQTVSGTTMHLSPYGEILVSNGDVCVQVEESGCSARGSVESGGGAPATGTGTGSGTGTTAAPTGCTEPTCATATNLCAAYPGATMTGCTEGASGLTASCCFAPAAPICFGVAGNAGCAAVSSGTGGSSAPAVCPQATCAGAVSPCGGFPGATFSGCTDSGNGWAGSCCFAPGTPVCVSDNTSVGCTSGGAPTGSGGSGGSSQGSGNACPAPPTCATSTACGDIVGSTAQSCTDTTSGFTATCCLPAGVLPSAFTGGGGSSNGSGGSTGGGSLSGPPSSDAGTSTGGFPPDGSTPPPPPPYDAGEGQMMPDIDAGKPPPTDPDSGQPVTQPDSGSGGQFDAGQPTQPDASACQYKVTPLGGGTCSVQGSCPGTGAAYQMLCTTADAGLASCICRQNGTMTGTAMVECATLVETDITMCGYPD